MERTKRLRRAGILCCHFIRNYAYYKSGWKNGELKVNDQFWVAINGNFLDLCVLEWYKLFGNYKDKHHWKKVMRHDQTFKPRMFETLDIKQTDLDKVHGSIKSYRDKFVAHLDSDEIMNIPRLDDAFQMVVFYYSELKSLCTSTADWPDNLEVFYKEHFEKGASQYEKHNN